MDLYEFRAILVCIAEFLHNFFKVSVFKQKFKIKYSGSSLFSSLSTKSFLINWFHLLKLMSLFENTYSSSPHLHSMIVEMMLFVIQHLYAVEAML